MAVIPGDLLDPRGPLQPVLFPNDTEEALALRLQGYIADALLQGATTDMMTRNWALYRGFDAAYTILLSNPVRVSFEGKGSMEFTASQLNALRDKANEYLALFRQAQHQPSIDIVPRTATTPNSFVW